MSGTHQIELKTGKMVNVPNIGSAYRIEPGSGTTLPSGVYKFKISFIDTAPRITDINVNVNV